MLRKLLSHAAIYALAAQLPRVAGVLALPVITPHLTPADYGVAGVVTAYVGALGLFQLLGLGEVMTTSFIRHPVRYSWIWRQIHGFLSIWSVLYGLLTMLVLYFIIPAEAAPDRVSIVCLYGIPSMFFTSTELQGNLYFRLSQKPLPLAIKSFIVGMVSVVSSIYLIAVLKLGYMGWFYSNFLAVAVSFALSSYYVYGRQSLFPIFNFKWHRLRQALKTALPLVPHHFSFYLFETSDRLVLDVLKVPVQRIGLYNLASTIGAHFNAVTVAVSEAATPFYLGYHAGPAKRDQALKARRLTFILQLLFLLSTSVVSLWMKEIFELLIKNESLQGAYPLAIVILMGYNFRPMYLAVLSLLTYHEKTAKLWKVTFVAGLGNVVLNFVLIPMYGYQAAAFTTFAALMYTGYSGFFLREFKAVSEVPYYPVRWLLTTVILLLAAYQLVHVDVAYKLAITALVLVGIAVLGWRYTRIRR